MPILRSTRNPMIGTLALLLISGLAAGEMPLSEEFPPADVQKAVNGLVLQVIASRGGLLEDQEVHYTMRFSNVSDARINLPLEGVSFLGWESLIFYESDEGRKKAKGFRVEMLPPCIVLDAHQYAIVRMPSFWILPGKYALRLRYRSVASPGLTGCPPGAQWVGEVVSNSVTFDMEDTLLSPDRLVRLQEILTARWRLASSHSQVESNCLMNLVFATSPHSISFLIRALGDADPSVRSLAVEAATKLADKKFCDEYLCQRSTATLGALLAQLRIEKSPRLQYEMYAAFGFFEDSLTPETRPLVKEALVFGLNCRSKDSRMMAALAFLRIFPEEAKQILAEKLAVPEWLSEEGHQIVSRALSDASPLPNTSSGKGEGK